MRPELSVPHSMVRVTAAIGLSFGAVLLVGFGALFLWQTFYPRGSDKESAATEQEKLNILAGLSGTTSLSEEERARMLEELSGGEEVSEQQKEAILRSLQQQ